MSTDHRHSHRDQPSHPPRSRSTVVLLGFLLVAGYFLYAEHKAHVIEYLPYLLLLACPLMHLFMHRGHGGHHGQARSKDHNQGES